MTRKMLIAAALGVVAATAFSAPASAQFYRGKTITMIINYPAGGPTDIEGRIVAQHLPAHIPGKPNVIVKNLGGAGGMIGSNHLGEIAKPDGETIGFFTWNPVAQLTGDPGLRVEYSDFVFIAGIENPVIVYVRKDTPPGLTTAADIMKASGFKALSLDAHNTNTVQQALALDLLGLKYKPVIGYRGLKEVETAILQNEGQLANSSLPGWRASIEPTMGKQGIVMPLWQVAPPGKGGSYPRSAVVPEMPTFEEFFASVNGGKKPSGIEYETMRTAIDAQTALFRTLFMPPKAPKEAADVLKTAVVELWKDPNFIRDYAKVVKSDPVLVRGEDGEEIMAALGKVRPQIKSFLRDYGNQLAKR
jgi:tripartite-type tricarboxylate transporter receptor subunit TctC